MLADLRSLRDTLVTARAAAHADRCRRSAVVCDIIENTASGP